MSRQCEPSFSLMVAHALKAQADKVWRQSMCATCEVARDELQKTAKSLAEEATRMCEQKEDNIHRTVRAL